jgi:hypothetical protein
MSTVDPNAASDTSTNGYLDFGRAYTAKKYGAYITFDRLTPPTGPSDIGFPRTWDEWRVDGWERVSGPEPIEYSEATCDEVLTKLRRVESGARSVHDVQRYVMKPTIVAAPPPPSLQGSDAAS